MLTYKQIGDQRNFEDTLDPSCQQKTGKFDRLLKENNILFSLFCFLDINKKRFIRDKYYNSLRLLILVSHIYGLLCLLTIYVQYCSPNIMSLYLLVKTTPPPRATILKSDNAKKNNKTIYQLKMINHKAIPCHTIAVDSTIVSR